MNNNQRNKEAGNMEQSNEATPFSNVQPGQVLPAVNNINTENKERLTEQHSEDSLPQNENETLGTP